MSLKKSPIGAVETLGIELGPVQLTTDEAAKVREGFEALQRGHVHSAAEVHQEMMKLIGRGE